VPTVLDTGLPVYWLETFRSSADRAGRAFEVASIKPSAPDARGTGINRPPGRLEIGDMTLKEMIVNAYSVQPFQVSGGPGWVDSVHYDISAKAGAQVSREDVLLMLQTLLADRFHLAGVRSVAEFGRCVAVDVDGCG
jgi:uncharacterized protein (TIGR03435 family)